MTDPTTDRPLVSIVVPMLDEIDSVRACLDSFERQSYPVDRIELLVVDGGSQDGSRELVEQRSGPLRVRVIDNPARRASAAFNRGVEAANGDVICLFSAHGVADERYVETSVAALRSSGAAGVGGRYLHVGVDPVSNAIGLAMVSPFGMASPHRFATDRSEVDTISHPAYWAGELRSVGPFDETLMRNSDYELNWRLRASGRTLVFDPAISSVYRPRRSLRALARQFWWYGRWKERVVSQHPGSLKPRHLVPPAFVSGLAIAPVVALTATGRRLIVATASVYGAMVILAVVQARPRQHRAHVPTLVACFPVIHLSWGGGYLLSLLQRVHRAVWR